MSSPQLSPWTLAWFACAMLFLIAALAGVVAGAGGPEGWEEGAGLAVLHLFALGWLGQMMLGALIQFVPVLAAAPLAFARLAFPVLAASAAGVLMLAAGFCGLAGWGAGAALLLLAPLPLGAAFAMAGLMLGTTLVRGREWRNGAGRAVLIALVSLALVWLSGAGMALALAGWEGGASLIPDAVPLHALAALAGWLSLAAFGVSYRLFAMFLLAPESDSRFRRATAAAGGALALALGLGLALEWAGVPDFPAPAPAPALALAAAAVAVALYLLDIRRIWCARRRAELEVNMAMSRVALAFLPIAAALAVPAAVLGGRWAEAAVFAALAGWLSLLTLAQMMKIVSFLTWIQVFAPRIGRARVPMVHDLTDAGITARWLRVWAAGAGTGTLALLAGSDPVFRLSALALLVAACGLAREALAIRRLAHLPPGLRPGALPPAILPASPWSVRNDPPRPART